jgi:protocatechuate 3,4-dioxygenase beta subunit
MVKTAISICFDILEFMLCNKKFLRGYQIADNNGTARFTTIYPGWYQGRAFIYMTRFAHSMDQRKL